MNSNDRRGTEPTHGEVMCSCCVQGVAVKGMTYRCQPFLSTLASSVKLVWGSTLLELEVSVADMAG